MYSTNENNMNNLTENITRRPIDTRSIIGANFNEDGDVIGSFEAIIEYSRSYSSAINKYSVEIWDYTILEGKATKDDIIEAAQIELRIEDVTINRF